MILAANKSEGRGHTEAIAEAYRLGFGEALALSAEHNIGTDDLLEALAEFGEEPDSDPAQDTDEPEQELEEDRPLRLAIVGRPNVGKARAWSQSRLLE